MLALFVFLLLRLPLGDMLESRVLGRFTAVFYL